MMRNQSIDLVRGLVMAIMVLDHARLFLHGGFGSSPTDLATTTPALFATRWITHFCAPVFVFLAGTAAFLRGRHTGRADQARFLVTRGLWLLLLELTLVRLGATFSMDPGFLAFLQVIWALGVAMIALAALLWLPLPAIGVAGIALVALHNLLDGIAVRGPATTAGDIVWRLLHEQGPLMPFGPDGPVAFVAYPVLPWIGVMAAGYAFGRVYTWPEERRRPFLLGLGAAMTLAFVVLRALNVYGDPAPWKAQDTALFSVLSFVNTTKYPPSLQYLLMTLGPAVALLGALDGRARGPLVTLGRVPLFFYLLQWPLAHLAGMIAAAAAGLSLEPYLVGPESRAFFTPRFHGLPAVYLAWAACLLVLYPLCAWFARVKQRSRAWWLSYL